MRKPQMKKQRGSGLIELMVSIAIGLILLLGMSTVFLTVNKTFKDRQGLGDLQNSQRMAMSFISAGIHMQVTTQTHLQFRLLQAIRH